MNLYLVLAIALGAISGVVDAPAARPAMSTLSARRDRRDHRQVIRVTPAPVLSRCSVFGFDEPRTWDRRPRTTGTARPRAPAIA